MWRLYYLDRTRFTSDDGGWADAPAWGVAAVAVPNPTVGVTIDTGDFYVFDGPHPWACDMWGLVDLLLRRGLMDEQQTMAELPPGVLVGGGVKFGRSADNDTWHEVWNWIVDDTRDWNHGKQGHYRWERVPV